VHALTKSYGDFQALKGIEFEVKAGEVFGLLGPNGAGKTTTVEILEGLRSRDAGTVSVLGLDPGQQSRELKDRIGVCLQATNLPDKIKVREALQLFKNFYSRTTSEEDLMKRLQLVEKKEAYYASLSGGQKQRLALALALINDPQVLFLDEPTAGLDPQARLEIHQLVQSLRQQQRTILLTTHYIEEAEKLCDRVAIIDGGKIIAMGTPQQIRDRTAGQSHIEIRFERPLPDGDLPQWADSTQTSVGENRLSMIVLSTHPARTLVDIVKWIDQLNIELADLHLKRPSLEDVFIEFTGRSLRE
jgi:ABC-2 type transport system ATP-binding protein